MRQITSGAFQPKNHLRTVPQGEQQFLFKPFPNSRILQGDAFVAEAERSGYPDAGNQGRKIGRFVG